VHNRFEATSQHRRAGPRYNPHRSVSNPRRKKVADLLAEMYQRDIGMAIQSDDIIDFHPAVHKTFVEIF